ncbi:MAG: hypothetical protein J6Y88_02090 [Bacteroidales bacterium]|nr:hypothetical protein [Bacteroidales bacterium]
MRLKQGNTYDIELELFYESGAAVTDVNASVVEIALGHKIKTWPGELFYDGERWIYHLSQEETLKMSGSPTLKARVKDLTDDVANCDICVVVVGTSNSKEVL